jgi:DNA-binding LytR/AlgR family response regulator
MRALVVEDERPAREYLVEILSACDTVQVVAAVATSDEARHALGPGGIGVDVAFVDIHLATSGGPKAGLSLVRECAGGDRAPLFVLATALKQHAVEAFDLGVTDYLLKPFSEERVRECLERILQRRAPPTARAPLRVVARSKKGLVFLRPEEVLAFEASERLIFVHTAAGRFDIDLSLAAVEASLGAGWLRVHRNWVVNVEQVKAWEREEGEIAVVVGAPGVRVPVARDRAQSVREVLLRGAAGLQPRLVP